jgi:hypothetical protein
MDRHALKQENEQYRLKVDQLEKLNQHLETKNA